MIFREVFGSGPRTTARAKPRFANAGGHVALVGLQLCFVACSSDSTTPDPSDTMASVTGTSSAPSSGSSAATQSSNTGTSTAGTSTTHDTTTQSSSSTSTASSGTSTNTTSTAHSSSSGASTGSSENDSSSQTSSAHSSSGETSAPPTLTLTQISENILTPNCGNIICHMPNYQEPNFLQDPEALRELLTTWTVPQCGDNPIVNPGDPENSAWLQLVKRECADGFVMPPGDYCTDPVCLREEDLADVTNWIAAGAPL